jgi:hypothetical protein
MLKKEDLLEKLHDSIIRQADALENPGSEIRTNYTAERALSSTILETLNYIDNSETDQRSFTTNIYIAEDNSEI